MSIIFVLIRTIESTARTIVNYGPFSKKRDNDGLIYRCPKEYPASFKEWYVDNKHPGFRQRYNRMFCKPKGGYLNKIQSQGVFVLLFRYFAILTMAFCIAYSILIGINDTTPEEGNDVSRLLAYLIMGNVPDDNDVVRYYHWGWYFSIFIIIMIAGVFFMAAITKRFLDENPVLVFAPKIFFEPQKMAFTVLCQNQDYTSLTDFEYYLGVSLIFNDEKKRQAFFKSGSDNNMCLLSAALDKNAVSIDSMVTIQMKTLPILDADTNNILEGLFNQLDEDLKYCYISHMLIDFILENKIFSSDSYEVFYDVLKKFHEKMYPNNKLSFVSEIDFLRCWVFLIMDKMNPNDKQDGNEKYQKLKKYEGWLNLKKQLLIISLRNGLKTYIEEFSTNIQSDDKYQKKVEERNSVFNKGYKELINQRDNLYKILKNNPRAVNYYIDDIKNLTISTVKLLLKMGIKPKYEKYIRLLNSIKKKPTKEDKADYTYNELADGDDLLTEEHKRKYIQLYPSLRIRTSDDGNNESLFDEPEPDKPDIFKRLRVIIHARSVDTGENFIWQHDYEMKDVVCGIAPIKDPVHWYDADLIELYNEQFDDLFKPTPNNTCEECKFNNNCPLPKRDLIIRPCTDKDWPLINDDEINSEVTKQLDQNVETLKTFLQSPRLTLGGFYNNIFVGFIVMSQYAEGEGNVQGNVGEQFDFLLDIQGDKAPHEPCKERTQIAYIELLLKEKYRRRFGFAALMIREMEKETIKKGFRFMATMVSPENEASIECFTNAGFETYTVDDKPYIYRTKEGYDRFLLFKRLESDKTAPKPDPEDKQ